MFILMIDIWTNCRGCIITIIPNSCLDSLLYTLLVFLFRDLCAKLEEWQSLHLVLFGNDHFHLYYFLNFDISLLLSLVILETLFCVRKQFSAPVLSQYEY